MLLKNMNRVKNGNYHVKIGIILFFKRKQKWFIKV